MEHVHFLNKVKKRVANFIKELGIPIGLDLQRSGSNAFSVQTSCVIFQQMDCEPCFVADFDGKATKWK